MIRKTDLSEAIQYLKLTLPEMSKRKIATTPENYAVWYEYTVGKNLALKVHIDTLDRKQIDYTEEVNAKLYEQFIHSKADNAEFNKLKDNVRQIIQELLESLALEGHELRGYSQTLNQFSEQIQSVSSPTGLQGLITELLQETRKREEATLGLQQSINNMAADIRDLRQEMERLNEEANTDSLTRLKNRRAFDIALDRAIAESSREQTPLTLILVDIDLFKQFNDKFGHPIGDKVLRFVGSILSQTVRGSDTIARYGGEEFAIILPETDYEGALAVAENCRSRISRQPLSDSKANLKLGSLTVSVGVGQYHYGESADNLLRRTDACMYQSKDQGRDRVTGEKDLVAGENSNYTWV